MILPNEDIRYDRILLFKGILAACVTRIISERFIFTTHDNHADKTKKSGCSHEEQNRGVQLLRNEGDVRSIPARSNMFFFLYEACVETHLNSLL